MGNFPGGESLSQASVCLSDITLSRVRGHVSAFLLYTCSNECVFPTSSKTVSHALPISDHVRKQTEYR
jgi:hypothetical protein